MAESTMFKAAKYLADKIHDINLGGKFSSWKGTSNGEAQLLKLRKSAAELVHAVGSKQSKEMILESYETLVAEINAAGLTGLIGNYELAEYHKHADNLWAAIEKEFK